VEVSGTLAGIGDGTASAKRTLVHARDYLPIHGNCYPTLKANSFFHCSWILFWRLLK